MLLRGLDAPAAGSAAPRVNTAPTELQLVAARIWLDARVEEAKQLGEPYAMTVLVTPAIATVLLERNHGNRKVSTHYVRRRTADIRNGTWQNNGQPIIVADTGELNDGQHRLLAIIAAGVAVKCSVSFGTTRESRKTNDLTMPRGAHHRLQMLGEVDTERLSAGLKALCNLTAGTLINTHRNGDEIEDCLYRNPDIRKSVGFGVRAARVYGQSSGPFTALHYQFARVSREDADRFFIALTTGVSDGKRTAVSQLRARLIDNMRTKAKLAPQEVAALIVKAWNLDMRGVRGADLPRVLAWRSAGPSPEDFPLIYGHAPRAR